MSILQNNIDSINKKLSEGLEKAEKNQNTNEAIAAAQEQIIFMKQELSQNNALTQDEKNLYNTYVTAYEHLIARKKQGISVTQENTKSVISRFGPVEISDKTSQNMLIATSYGEKPKVNNVDENNNQVATTAGLNTTMTALSMHDTEKKTAKNSENVTPVEPEPFIVPDTTKAPNESNSTVSYTSKPSSQKANIQWNPEVEKINTKNATTEIVGTQEEEMRELQADAEKTIRELLVKGNQLDLLSFKRAISVTNDLANLQENEALLAGMKISPEEREVLKQSMPAVRGMIGAIFVKALVDNHYDIRFDGAGRAVIGGIHGAPTPKLLANQDMNILVNEEIARNPNFSEILKAGMLFHSGDLMQYAARITDKNGIIENVNSRKYSDFTEFLAKNNNPSPVTNMIVHSEKLFSDAQFQEYLRSAQHVPAIDASVQTLVNDPATQKQVETALKNESEKGKTYDSITNIFNEPESPVGKLLHQWGSMVVDIVRETTSATGLGLKEYVASPQAAILTALIFLGTWWAVGFKKAAWFALGGAFLIGGWQKWGGDIMKKNNSAQEDLAIPAANEKAVEAARKKIHEGKDLNEVLPIIEKFQPSKIKDIYAFMKDGSGDLTQEQKQLLSSDPEAKKILENEVNGQVKKFDDLIASSGALEQEGAKEFFDQFKQNATLKELTDLANADEATLKDYIVKQMRAKLEAENPSPEERAEAESMIEQVQNASWWDIGKLVVLVVVTVGAVAYAATSVISGIITRVTKNIIKSGVKWTFSRFFGNAKGTSGATPQPVSNQNPSNNKNTPTQNKPSNTPNQTQNPTQNKPSNTPNQTQNPTQNKPSNTPNQTQNKPSNTQTKYTNTFNNTQTKYGNNLNTVNLNTIGATVAIPGLNKTITIDPADFAEFHKLKGELTTGGAMDIKTAEAKLNRFADIVNKKLPPSQQVKLNRAGFTVLKSGKVKFNLATIFN